MLYSTGRKRRETCPTTGHDGRAGWGAGADKVQCILSVIWHHKSCSLSDKYLVALCALLKITGKMALPLFA